MGLNVRDDLFDAKDELSGFSLDLVLLFDLIKGDSVFRLVPINLGQFEELEEDEGVDLFLAPSIGNDSILKPLYLAGQAQHTYLI